MKIKLGFLSQSDIKYMCLLADELKKLSKNAEYPLQINEDNYKALKENLLKEKNMQPKNEIVTT